MPKSVKPAEKPAATRQDKYAGKFKFIIFFNLNLTCFIIIRKKNNNF